MLDRSAGRLVAVTGVFIAVNARAEIAYAGVGERLDGVKVGELTWFGVAETGTDMDADSMIWQRSRLGGAGAVAVRGDDGELDGLVLEDQLWAVPAEQRPWVMLTSLMAPFDRLAQADPDDDLAAVLPSSTRCARSSPCGATAGCSAWSRPTRSASAQLADVPAFPLAGQLSPAQASPTAQSRLATGSLSLHGKLIHRSVRLHT